MDELFAAADTSDDEFSVLQVSYENIGRLLAQLDDGLDYVDPDVRDDLEESLDFTAELITVFSTAEDETTANETIDSLRPPDGASRRLTIRPAPPGSLKPVAPTSADDERRLVVDVRAHRPMGAWGTESSPEHPSVAAA